MRCSTISNTAAPKPARPAVPIFGALGQLLREQRRRQLAALGRLAGHIDSLQPPFSLVTRRAAASEIPWCARHRTGVICYSPMQSGLLTDTFSREHVTRFAEDDWRRRSPDFNEPHLSRNLALRDALRPIAQRHGATVSALAVAGTLAWPGVSVAIVGGRSPQQVDGWIGAASFELTAADLQEISDAVVRTGAGEGPTVPQLARADASH